MDLKGNPMPMVAYVVPEQEDNLVLGLGWMEKYDVSLHPSRSEIALNRPMRMTVSTRLVEIDTTINETSATALKAWSARLRKQPSSNVKIFSASMADIQKAL